MSDDTLDTTGAVQDYLKGPDFLGGPDPATQARVSVATAVGTNSDFEAELRRVAQRTGVPMSSARAMPEDVKRRATLADLDFDDMAQRLPSTVAFLAEKDNALVAHDDIENMGLVESTLNSFKRGWRGLKQLGPTLTLANQGGALANIDDIDKQLAAGKKPEEIASSQLGPLANMYAYMTLEERAAFRRDVVPTMPSTVSKAAARVAELQVEKQAIPAKPVAQEFSGAKTWGEAFKALARNPLDILATIGPESLVQSLPGIAAAIPATIVAGPAGGAATIGANSFAVDYAATVQSVLQESGVDLNDAAAVQKAMQDPAILAKTLDQASKHAGVVAAVDAVSGGLASKVLLPASVLAKKPVARAAASVGVQTVAQGALGAAGEAGGQVAAGQELQPGQILAEAVGEVVSTPGEVAGMSAGRIREAARDRAALRQKVVESTQDAQSLQALVQTAAKSKLMARDPQALADFVQKVADKGDAPSEVFVDAKAFAEALNQNGITVEQAFAAMPSIERQFAEAAASGGDIAIPIGEFTAGVAGSSIEQALMQHVRTDPEALSQAEATQLMKGQAEALKADAERIIAEQGAESEAAQSAATVRGAIYDQLQTAGRFKPDVNAAYADMVRDFYTVQAQRLGLTPEELFKKHPLTIKAEGLFAPSEALSQTGDPGAAALELGKVDGLFQYPKSAATDFAQLAQEKRPGLRIERETVTQPDGSEKPTGNWNIVTPSGDDAIVTERDGKVWINVAGLAPGSGGSLVYDLVANYALNNGLKFIGDPAGLSNAAMVRRTENMLSSAIKYGTTDHLEPHPKQLKGNDTIPALTWRDGDTAANVRSMMEAVVTASAKLSPSGSGVEYDAATGRTTDSEGVTLDADGLRAISDLDRGASGAGSPGHTTLQRAALFRALLSGPDGRRAVLEGLRGVPSDGGPLARSFYQDEQVTPRGTFAPSTSTITLLAKADLSTFLHETGHFYLETLAAMASAPDAPAEIVQDMAKVLEWFGFEGTAADWLAGDVNTRRDAHEKFARGFEAYLFEGKAPSTELTRLFGRFRAWLTHIYKSIRALDVEINDDIRSVFDRLLASEQQIKEAEAARAYAPLFADEKALKEAGVDPATYHALGAEATETAVADLQRRSLRDMQWLTNAKGRALKALQKEAKEKRKAIEAEVTAEVDAMPEYRAADLIAESDKEFADDPFAADPGLRRGAIADALNFPSVDAMVRAIEEAPPRAEVIEGMTDQRMLEEHGELSSPEALQRAAEEAIHNEARGKFIATELSALNKALGPARVLMAAAKQFAEAVIGTKVITDIKPHLYVAAETRAAKQAEKSLGKSTDEAAIAKRNQLLNHYAARYARDALTEIDRIREFFKRVADTPDDRLKSRDMDVVNAARAVLAAYGVGRKGEAAAEYLKRVAAYDPEMSGVLHGSVDAALAGAKPLTELTLDELRALNDEVAGLWHLAKRSRQMEIDGDLLDREEVQEDLKARLIEIGIPDRIAGEGSAVTPAEQRLAKLKTYLASARRTESWVGAMDGANTGVFRRYIWQPVKEAADAYRTDRARLLKQYRELLATIAPTMRKRIIDAPELGYTFGKDTGGVALNEILHAILHTGNSSNKKKLLLGRKWATENADGSIDTSRWDAFIDRMAAEGVLTKAHFDFVQGVWDLLESTKPLAQKTHRDVFGKYFAEVTAEPVATPFGQYAGGYAPAVADPRVVSDAKTRALMEDENASMAFAFPATNKGFTKGRVEYNRPLTLDLGTLAQHIDKVLLFSHMERPIRDVRRVLTAKGVAYGVNRIDPAAFDSIISPWLNRAARQQVTTPSPGHWQSWRLWSTLRNRAGMAAMFGNVVNAAQQITGFSIAAVKVRPKHLLGAVAHYVANPRQLAADVAAASPYMEGRISNEVAAMNDAIKDILIDPSLYERTQQWTMRHAYFLQSAVDNVMSPIIWIAARNQALEQGQSEKEAGRFADAAVRQTQGSTLPEDISNWEAGSSFSRMFSQFAGYFNMQANLLGTEFQTIARDMGLRKGAGRGLYVLVLAALAPAWVSELIVQAFRGGPDDEDKDGEYLDDWLQAVFGMATLRGLTAMIPIFGQGANAVVNATNSKPYDDRLATSPAVSMVEAAVRAPVDVYKAAFEDGDKSRAVKDVASLISLLTGIPANIAARPLSYAVDVQEGDVNPTGPADMARGLVTGRASPGSK